jgi:hypothetical protein
MDLTLPQDLRDVGAAIAELCAQASKDALASYARAKCAWRGDDARTSKSDIARAILEWHQQHQGEPVKRAPRELFKAPAVDDIQGKIAQAIGAALAGLKFGVDEESVRSIIREELSQVEPARIIVTPTKAKCASTSTRTRFSRSA